MKYTIAACFIHLVAMVMMTILGVNPDIALIYLIVSMNCTFILGLLEEISDKLGSK